MGDKETVASHLEMSGSENSAVIFAMTSGVVPHK
jgi:hypothetical protein